MVLCVKGAECRIVLPLYLLFSFSLSLVLIASFPRSSSHDTKYPSSSMHCVSHLEKHDEDGRYGG